MSHQRKQRREPPEWRGGLYRSRKGVIFGVCRGLAEYMDFSVFWMRVIWVCAAILPVISLPFVIIAYFVAALLIKPEPVVPFENESEREFYDSYASSRTMALGRLKRTYDNLDRRLQRIESIVTSSDFRWNDKLENGPK